MKNSLTKRDQEHGGVLIVTLFIASLFGLFLFSYLYLVRQQNTVVARSQAWNSAFAMAEAGVEEALAQLNPGAPLPVIDRTANGWGQPSGGLYGPVARTLSSGSYSVAFTTNTLPIIYSTGYVSVASIPATLSRSLRVATTNVPLFTVAMAAKFDINMNGNNITTDSFDSSNPNLSNNGLYDPTRTSTNGDVASIGGVVNVGNANVHGEVLLGPTASDSIQNNGFISGGVYNDFNFTFPDVVLPQTTWTPALPLAVPLTVNGITYQYALLGPSGDYTINNLSGNVYVGPLTHIRLKLTGNASPQYIRVAGSGVTAASLVIYMDGPSFTLTGNSIVDGGIAADLTYFGTTNNTSISFSGNASFTGTIYAPEANFTLGGGGNNTYDFVGSCIVNSVTMNGHFNFHFDEDLLHHGPIRGYAASAWSELEI